MFTHLVQRRKIPKETFDVRVVFQCTLHDRHALACDIWVTCKWPVDGKQRLAHINKVRVQGQKGKGKGGAMQKSGDSAHQGYVNAPVLRVPRPTSATASSALISGDGDTPLFSSASSS